MRKFFHATVMILNLCLSRPRHGLLIATGLLIASATLLIVLTIPAGLERIAAKTGRDDVAVILASSRMDESDGNLSPELVKRIGDLPGVARTIKGSPLIAPQFVVHVKLQRHDGMPATAIVRGSTSAIWSVVGDSVRIDRGKPFADGLEELASGALAARKYVYAQAGASINLQRSAWRVSGEFDANGNLWESELWADIDSLQSIYNAQGQITTVWVRLSSPDAYAAFADAMQSDVQLRGLPHMKQRDFYARRVAILAQFVRIAAWVIAIVLGLCAILASQNAIGLSLRARRRDLAVLRAIGFGNGTLMAALLVEILLIAAVCAAVGIGIGLIAFNGNGIDSSTLDASIHFTTAVTPGVAVSTLCYALALGLISVLIPAWRSLHAPLVTSLTRE
jgi:putative ABC transport system permease protein